MNQFSFHQNSPFKPPHQNLPIIQRLVNVYKLWNQILPHVPKIPRFGIGAKIDIVFIETAEATFKAIQSNRENKLNYVEQSSTKLEILKFLLQVAWETKALDNKKYINLSEQLNEVGRMIGGWMKKLQKENSAR